MDWLKRNLVFVIAGAVSLLALGFAGFYGYSGWRNNGREREAIEQNYGELNSLYNARPAPGDGKKVNNIQLAKEQQVEALEFAQKLSAYLEYVPALPGGTDITIATTCIRAGSPIPPEIVQSGKTNVTARAFSAALQETIAQLQRECTNSSVNLPPRYKFSFEKQSTLVTFAPNTVEFLAVQLGEVKAIVKILNEAKINSLDSIQRERVPGSPDDLTGPATDYTSQSSITNEFAIITPYEITFRSFTPELAATLGGFAASPYAFVVKAINVEPAPASMGTEIPGAPNYQQPIYPTVRTYPNQAVMTEEGAVTPGYPRYGVTPGNPYGGAGNRYGGNRVGANPNPYGVNPYQPNPYAYATAVPGAASTTKSGLQTLLQEKQLRVTLLVHVVKRLPVTQ